jgi:hypothetical protein
MYDDLGAMRKVRAAFADFDVVASGPILDGDPPYVPGSIACKDADQAREAVRSVKREGANFVKVYSLLSRGHISPLRPKPKPPASRLAGTCRIASRRWKHPMRARRASNT